ncbi:MAG: hypothetical protein JNG88_18065 [Phycisphaerales bacterium]|nr:hypothetical protein [Phycisphaerales bacterium]
MIPTLAHGAVLVDLGFWFVLAFVPIAKAALYWLLVWAFRYRVSSVRPAQPRRVVAVTGLRGAVGPLVLLAGWATASVEGGVAGYLVMSVVRLVAWVFVGSVMRLRGMRYVGFVLSGMWIDLSADIAIYAAAGRHDPSSTVLASVPLGLLIAAPLLGVLLVPLCLSSKSSALLARFQSDRVCRKCGYDLTGNVTGVCPECGTAIKAEGASEKA